MNWLFSKCRRYRKALSLLALGELPQPERNIVQRHLADCLDCSSRFAELQAIIKGGATLASHLPEVETPPSLRSRWSTSLDHTKKPEQQSTLWLIPGLSMRRAAWGTLAVVWGFILLFRFSGPETSKTPVAAAPPSWGELVLVLRVEPKEPGVNAKTSTPPPRKPENSSSPPHSERFEHAIRKETA